MRYENWDVLLFPAGSKVPLQEFKTQCFATRDLDSPYLYKQRVIDNTFPFHPQDSGQGGGPGQLPLLTSFVPSLSRGSPFRVSVHSWDKPGITKLTESLMQPDDMVMYEVRVFIDGHCISGSVVNTRAQWPHIIDLSSHMDRNGNQDVLRFPPFHEEILHHARWDATEVYGRIRVTVSEGLARPLRNPPFERVRDVVVFSFQHAPLHVLEQSNIAWPNPGMWQEGPRPFIKYTAGYQSATAKDDEAHSHSPTRHEVQVVGGFDGMMPPNYSMWPYRLYPTPTIWQPSVRPGAESGWSGWAPPVPVPAADPFFGPFRVPAAARHMKSSIDDISMPDYIGSTSSNSRVISGATGASSERANKEPSAPAPMDDEQYNQLIEALSPKKFKSGTCAPANTPTSAQQPAAKPESRRARRTSSTGRPGPLQEISQPTSRVPSNASLESAVSDKENIFLPGDLLTPSMNVVGRKERRSSKSACSGCGSPRRKSSGKKNLSPGGQQESLLGSEGKRKRQNSSVDATALPINLDKDSPSPSKKVTRRADKEEQSHGLEALLDATSMLVTGCTDLEEVV